MLYNKGTMRTIPVIALIVFLLTLPSSVSAAKPRIRKASSEIGPGVSYSAVRISRPTNSIRVTFANLNLVKSTTYSLSYVANGIQQGVVGTIKPGGQTTDARDLYVGTCSKGVCTPHFNIRAMSLLVQTTLTSGGVYTKRYRIKF